MRVDQAIAETIAANKIDTMFGLMGTGNLGLIDHHTKGLGGAYYAARHETGAVAMADAWARVTGNIGVCTVTQGPGVTNALTGLVEARKSSTPLIVLTSEPAHRHHQQFLDMGRVLKGLDLEFLPLGAPNEAVDVMHEAFRLAYVGRRPVIVSSPVSVQRQEYVGIAPTPTPGLNTPRFRPDDVRLERAIGRICSARLPVILAGRGAVVSEAHSSLETLGDRIGALLATSVAARGFFEGAPYDIGVSGGFSSGLAKQLLGQADLLIAFGAGLNDWTMGHGRLYSSVTVVHCDSDPAAIGRINRADEALVGDVTATADALVSALVHRDHKSTGWRNPETAAAIAAFDPRDEYEEDGTTDRADPRSVVIGLGDLLTGERTVIVDSGHFVGFPCMYLPGRGERSFVYSQSFMSLGLGFAGGIGAAVARPNRLSVTVLGDGGSLMSLGELDTAVRYNLPTLYVIINDAAYGAEVHQLADLGMSTDLASFEDRDFAGLARQMGALGITVQSVADLEGLRPWLASPDGPMVVDCKVNPTVRAAWFSKDRWHKNSAEPQAGRH